MAFLMRRTRRGEERWVVRWADAAKGASQAGRREVDCVSGDHADALDAAGLSGEERAAIAGAVGARSGRARLLACYRVLERQRRWQGGGPGRRGAIRDDLEEVALMLASLTDRVESICTRMGRA